MQGLSELKIPGSYSTFKIEDGKQNSQPVHEPLHEWTLICLCTPRGMCLIFIWSDLVN
jgi:hypothetical protein